MKVKDSVEDITLAVLHFPSRCIFLECSVNSTTVNQTFYKYKEVVLMGLDISSTL